MTTKPAHFLGRLIQWILNFFRSLFGSDTLTEKKPKATQVTVREESPNDTFISVFFDTDPQAYVGGSVVLGNNAVTLNSLQVSGNALFTDHFTPATYTLLNEAIDVKLYDAAGQLVSENQAFGGRAPMPTILTVNRNAQGQTTSLVTTFDQPVNSYGNADWMLIAVDSANNKVSELLQLTGSAVAPDTLNATHWQTPNGQQAIDWDMVTTSTELTVNVANVVVPAAEYSTPNSVEIRINQEQIHDEVIPGDKEKPKATQVTVREEHPLTQEAGTFFDIRFDGDVSAYAKSDDPTSAGGSITLGNPVEATFTGLSVSGSSNQVLTPDAVDPENYTLPSGQPLDVKLYDAAGLLASEQEVFSGVYPNPTEIQLEKDAAGTVTGIAVTFDSDPNGLLDSNWGLVAILTKDGNQQYSQLDTFWGNEDIMLYTNNWGPYQGAAEIQWADIEDGTEIEVQWGNINAFDEIHSAKQTISVYTVAD